MTAPAGRVAHASRLDAAAWQRLVVVTVLGFASGLPLALTGQAMQAWLSVEGIDIATIGFLSLVGLPYTFKFLWAPLMDRFELPWLGRRRGWLVLTQLALAGALVWMAATPPTDAIRSFALLACLVAFLSASQDVVVDAYRTDLLPASERGLGSSLSVLGYRLSMILSGAIASISAAMKRYTCGQVQPPPWLGSTQINAMPPERIIDSRYPSTLSDEPSPRSDAGRRSVR